MNTNTITSIKTAIVTALLSDKPSLKIGEKLEQSLFDAIISNIPEQHEDKPSADILAAFAKALSERNILLDSNNPVLAHVSDSQLFSRHEGQDKPFTPAQDYLLDNLTPSWDTVIRLATIIVKRHKRARPDKLATGNNLQLHLAAEALEALTWVNGAEPSDNISTNTSNTEVFDFAAYGLDRGMFEITIPKSIYTMPKNAGTKLYLLPEHRGEFDALVERGILSDDYGRNKVQEGPFKGLFAVLVLPQTSK